MSTQLTDMVHNSFVSFGMIHLLDIFDFYPFFLQLLLVIKNSITKCLQCDFKNVWPNKPNKCPILACCVKKTSLCREVIRTCYGYVVVYQFVCTPWIEKLFWSVHCE